MGNNPLTRCDSCGARRVISKIVQLEDMQSLTIRLDLGGEVPAGECPDCGAFCYLVKKRKKKGEKMSINLYPIEQATGRARCRSCKKEIRKDTPALLAVDDYKGGRAYWHIVCVAEMLDQAAHGPGKDTAKNEGSFHPEPGDAPREQTGGR
jgi:hypothetical protein